MAQKNTVLVDPGSILFLPVLLGGAFFLRFLSFLADFILVRFPPSFRFLVLTFLPVIVRRDERRDTRIRSERNERVQVRVDRRAEMYEPTEPGVVERVHFSFFL